MYTLIVTTASGTTQKEWKHEKHAFASFNGICMAMVRNNESGIVQMLKGGDVVMQNNVNYLEVTFFDLQKMYRDPQRQERIQRLLSILKEME